MSRDSMYTRSAEVYKHIYAAAGKDYRREVKYLRRLITKYTPQARDLLDVACGDGMHLKYLSKYYNCEGLDLSEHMIRAASKNAHGIPLHTADMTSFELSKKFDIITCLFSSIGYVRTKKRLMLAFKNMTRHLKTGGLVIIEPWLTPGSYKPDGTLYSVYVDKPGLKILRANISEKTGRLSKMVMHYMVASREGIDYFREKHVLGLFTGDEYKAAMENCGMEVYFDKRGLTGRGLFLGTCMNCSGN